MADTTGTERILNRLRGRAALWTFSALVPVVFLTLVVMEPFVYVLGGEPVVYRDLAPRVVDLGLPESQDGSGGLIASDLDGDGRRDFVITEAGRVTAVGGSGARLWSKEADIHLTSKAEDEGLPGLHASGVQAADIDGDGTAEVLFLTRGGALAVFDGASGVERASVPLPAPPPAAAR